MSDLVLKPVSNTMSLTTANTVSRARLVYLAVPTTALVTVFTGANTSLPRGSLVLLGNETYIIEKNPDDLMSANVAVNATAIVYRG